MNANRPLSPHLQIYRPQITSVLSILHRICGVALGLGSLFLALWLYGLAFSPMAFDLMREFWASLAGRVLLFGWTFALFYHLANGVRHLLWDLGIGFSLKAAALSGYAVLAFALALTLLAFGLGGTGLGGAP